jgi:diguanylate cyclase (GGDEF)-like protein/PAS domain S-box-containing protein
VLETGQPLSVDEYEVALPDVGLRRLDVRAVRVGDLVSFTWRDVTSRVEAAREIAQSREHYRLLAENASEMVFRSGDDGRIQWASPSVSRVLGWPPEHFVGRRMTELIHPDDLPRLLHAMREILDAGGLVGQTELRMATSDGGWRWMSSLGRALVDDQGVLIGGVDAVRDIQVQKDAQIALEESEERFRRSMMDAAIGMAIVSPSGEFVRVNPAMSTLLGRDEATLMASTWQELTHPDDLHIDLQLVQDVVDGTRETYRLPKRYLKPSGEIVWADLTVSGVRDESGCIKYFVSQVTDITDAVLAREALASSEEHYRFMAENSSDVVFRGSVSGRLEWISPSVQEVLGWTREQLIGVPMLEYLMPEDLPSAIQLGPGNRDRIDFEGRCRTPDGSYIWMDISSRPLLDESGTVVGRVGRLRDIQVEHAAREALRGSEQRFRAAMESAPTGMAVVNLQRGFVQVNPALCRLLGRSEQWLLEHGLSDVMDPVDDDLDRRLRALVLTGVDSAPVRDHQMIRSDGERVLVEQSIGLLRDDSGRASGYVSQFVDVTEARAARDQLRFLATHDSMTALFNRHELVSRISGILSKRPRTGINVGVLFIDLDGLKPVNDTYGHAVGDAVIVTVADRIRSRVRSDDVLARFGGDEFVLVLPAIHTVGNAERIAASLHEVVAAPMEIEGHSIVMTLSIGVALVEPGDNADAALRQADAALYRAKRQGKACTVIYDPAWEG